MNFQKLIKKTVAVASILSVLNTGAVFGQNSQRGVDDYLITGYGSCSVIDNEYTPIPDVKTTWRPLEMEGDSMPPPYTYYTDSDGIYDYDVWVFWELYVNVNDHLQKRVVEVRPNPSSDFTFNFLTEQRDGELYVFDMSGRVVDVERPTNYVDEVVSYYTDLSGKADGTYVYFLKTPEKVYNGKIVKLGDRVVGDLGVVVDNTLKEARDEYEAVYEVTYEKEGWETLVDTVTVTEGDNGFMAHFMTYVGGGGVPQYQYIGGVVRDESDDGLDSVFVRITVADTVFDEMYTNSQGEFLSSVPVPANTDFVFDAVGGVDGKFSFSGDESSTIEEVVDPDDTLRTVYNYVLYDKERIVPNTSVTATPTAYQIKEMYMTPQSELGIRWKILWEITYGWTSAQKAAIRSQMQTGMSLFGLDGVYVEVDHELNNVDFTKYDGYNVTYEGDIGLRIRSGGDWTNPYDAYVEPVDRPIYVYCAAEVSLSLDYNAFYKENFGRSLGIGAVSSRNSFMNSTATQPNNLDRVIVNMIAHHYVRMFNQDVLTAYFGLENITDSINAPETKEAERVSFNYVYKK